MDLCPCAVVLRERLTLQLWTVGLRGYRVGRNSRPHGAQDGTAGAYGDGSSTELDAHRDMIFYYIRTITIDLT
jgi:hypothetical protein